MDEWETFRIKVLKPQGLDMSNGDGEWLREFYLRRLAAQKDGPEAEKALNQWVNNADESTLDRGGPIIRVIAINTESPRIRNVIEKMTRRSRGRS